MAFILCIKFGVSPITSHVYDDINVLWSRTLLRSSWCTCG